MEDGLPTTPARALALLGLPPGSTLDAVRRAYKAQALRSVSATPGRRMSHNPPQPVTLDIYDRLGVLVMDESRTFGDAPGPVADMAELVKRDRNHPSVVIW